LIPLSGEALDHRQHFISFNSSKTRKGGSGVGYTGAFHETCGELAFFTSFSGCIWENVFKYAFSGTKATLLAYQ
jgi:hypothetical protein